MALPSLKAGITTSSRAGVATGSDPDWTAVTDLARTGNRSVAGTMSGGRRIAGSAEDG
jgi:hypothetical protein